MGGPEVARAAEAAWPHPESACALYRLAEGNAKGQVHVTMHQTLIVRACMPLLQAGIKARRMGQLHRQGLQMTVQTLPWLLSWRDQMPRAMRSGQARLTRSCPLQCAAVPYQHRAGGEH